MRMEPASVDEPSHYRDLAKLCPLAGCSFLPIPSRMGAAHLCQFLHTLTRAPSRGECMPIQNHLNIILYKAYADLRTESEKYFISYLWWVLEPIFQMCVYYVVFGLLFDNGTPNFVPFLLIGLVTWRWGVAIINEGIHGIPRNKHLIRQVYLPKYIFPSVALFTQSFKFSIVFSLLLIYLWIDGHPPHMGYLGLPLVFLAHLSLVMGLTYMLSALIPYLPDLRLLVDTGLQLLFFLSGVFFSGDAIPEEYKTYFYLNPMAQLLDAYRHILLFQEPWELQKLILIGGLGIVGIVIGLLMLKANDHHYAKVVT